MDKPCVMVVEDEAPILDAVREFLQLEGMEAIGAARPELVEPLAEQVHPQLFVIDIMLMGKSGIEVASSLQDHGFRDTPMIAMSASQVMMGFARSSGVFDAYIPKPFDFGELVSTIRELLPEGD